MMNWMRFRIVYFLVSALFLGLSVFGLIKWGLKLGVDFKGGNLSEYKVGQDFSTEDLQKKLKEERVEITSIQKTGEKTYLFRSTSLDEKNREKMKKVFTERAMKFEELRFENVGPTIGPELIKKTVYAIILAAIVILLWVAYQFKSFKFGLSAVLAMFHDSFILIGAFSFFGYFGQVEIDFLFVTALLTTLSFSVHDTIVVYDRIRETQKKYGGSLKEIADKAISETMVRSLNNSFTIIFMLVALILLGGSTIKWFSVALFIGTVFGTYSSPFVAVPLLITWDEIEKKLKK